MASPHNDENISANPQPVDPQQSGQNPENVKEAQSHTNQKEQQLSHKKLFPVSRLEEQQGQQFYQTPKASSNVDDTHRRTIGIEVSPKLSSIPELRDDTTNKRVNTPKDSQDAKPEERGIDEPIKIADGPAQPPSDINGHDVKVEWFDNISRKAFTLVGMYFFVELIPVLNSLGWVAIMPLVVVFLIAVCLPQNHPFVKAFETPIKRIMIIRLSLPMFKKAKKTSKASSKKKQEK